MVTWPELRQQRPDLADAGRALLYQFGVGLAFLATARADGRPRVHPVCPVVTDDGLYVLVIPSPKAGDLSRDGHYALHGFPPAENEDAFYLTGRAEQRLDKDVRGRVEQQFLEERKMTERPPDFDDQQLFELLIDSCLLTRTTGHGDFDPQHTIWHAGS